MTYTLSLDSSLIEKDNGDGSFTYFHLDQVNSDFYVEYQKWLSEGNTPNPAPQLPPDPVLTPEQKLEAAGLTVAELRELLNLPADES